MNKEIITTENIKNLIYEVRGVKVIIDSDLAYIYGYDTKRFNEQVKNNKDKFPDRYRFQLTNYEYEPILRSKKSTSSLDITKNF